MLRIVNQRYLVGENIGERVNAISDDDVGEDYEALVYGHSWSEGTLYTTGYISYIGYQQGGITEREPIGNDIYMWKIELGNAYGTNKGVLSMYKELLLCLTEINKTVVIGSMFIPDWNTNRLTGNYEFSNGSYRLEAVLNDEIYYIGMYILNDHQLYLDVDRRVDFYLFGKIPIEEDEE